MAYKDIFFPQLRLIHGISKTRGDNTVVFGNGYKEYRIRRSDIDPLTWTFPPRDLTVEDGRELIDFYNSVDGGLDSFKFKDPDDYQWDRFRLEYYKDDKWKVKSLSGSPIFKGVIINVHLQDVPQGGSVIQLDDTEPYISVPGSTSGSKVEVTGEFSYVVRFATGLSYSYNALDSNNDTLAVGIDSFQLKEVSEYA